MFTNYQQYGVEGYYEKFGDAYSNPHFTNIKYIFPKILQQVSFPDPQTNPKILDLACGSGEITTLLAENGYDKKYIVGMDPYTSKNYERNTGCPCLENSFHDILSGSLNDQYYAVHLIDPDCIFSFFNELASMTSQFLIITHMKKFEVNNFMWKVEKEIYFQHEKIKVINLVRINYY